MEPSLDGLGVPKANLVSCPAEGEIELVLADDPEGGDSGLQGSAPIVGVLEDEVRGDLITQNFDVGELSDEIQHPVVLSSLNEGQTFRDQIVYEAEGLSVLDDFELRTYYSVGLISSLPLGAESPRNGGSIPQEYRNLLHSVVQVGDSQGLFHRVGGFDVGANGFPGSGADVHVLFLLDFG